MSKEWINESYKVVLEANTHLVMELVKEIPQTEVILMQSLTKLVQQFKFEELVDLTEPRISNES